MGRPIGIMMLRTSFPRPPGDIGNPATWPFPVLYETVEPATVQRVVNREPALELLLEPFISAGNQLVESGAGALTTSCGFLVLLQRELGRRLSVPVMTSSLQQVPFVQASLPSRQRVGVISVHAENLTPAHLLAAGAPADTPVVGTEGGRELTRVIMNDLDELDYQAARQDVLDAGEALLAKAPAIGAIVLECTNMAPYARDLQAHLDRPVYDIVSLICWLQSGLMPRSWRV